MPEEVLFSHPNFTKDVSGKGNGDYAVGTERTLEHNINDEASASADNKVVIIRPPSITMSFDKAVETIKVIQKNRISRNGQQDDDAPETASKDISTDEATTTGELPNADWDNIDDQTDDSHLYLNKFESYFKMLDLLKGNNGCELVVYSLRKLPKVARFTKHLLATDGNPRCLSVSYIEINNVAYYLLKVDTSDTNKPLSTKVIYASPIEHIDDFIENVENVEKQLLRASISWPKKYFDNFVGKSNHFGIFHQQSDKNGSLTFEDISNWAERFFNKL
ncbi:MAG: hypothetical protein ACJAZQ_001847 [Cognaticolwellia sp.]